MTGRKSLREKTLKVHLDTTKDQHDGLGYADWRYMRDTSDEYGHKLYRPIDIIRRFNIGWDTYHYWVIVDKEERADERN